MRVLIVDDDIRLASVIRRGLRKDGLLADVAVKGEDEVATLAASFNQMAANLLKRVKPQRYATAVTVVLAGSPARRSSRTRRSLTPRR